MWSEHCTSGQLATHHIRYRVYDKIEQLLDEINSGFRPSLHRDLVYADAYKLGPQCLIIQSRLLHVFNLVREIESMANEDLKIYQAFIKDEIEAHNLEEGLKSLDFACQKELLHGNHDWFKACRKVKTKNANTVLKSPSSKKPKK